MQRSMSRNLGSASGPPPEEDFLARLAGGKLISQEEYDQMAPYLPEESVAAALARRFACTGETRLLVEAARLYAQCSQIYPALEICSRAPNLPELRRIIRKILPALRREYPDTGLLGKLTDEALLVIDLRGEKITRFPPILPATEFGPVE
jgi:hypothetical protein